MAYGFVALTIVFTVLGQYFQKLAADELLADFTPTRALDYLGLMLDRHMLGAMASLALAMACWLLALQWLDVSKAYPLLAVNYVAMMALARWRFGEAISLSAWLGVACILAGISLVAGS